MNKPGTLFTTLEIYSTLSTALRDRVQVQCIFNQGKHVYLSNLCEVNEHHVTFDFGSVKETDLRKTIDFYSPTVFVFFHQKLRYQFLSTKSSLLAKNGHTLLQISLPNSIHIVEGRQSSRIDLPLEYANVEFSTDTKSYNIPIREMSTGGFSLWHTDNFGLAPHATLRTAKMIFPSLNHSFSTPLEIVRIQYLLGNTQQKSHLISFKFTHLLEKERAFLQKHLAELDKFNQSNG